MFQNSLLIGSYSHKNNMEIVNIFLRPSERSSLSILYIIGMHTCS